MASWASAVPMGESLRSQRFEGEGYERGDVRFQGAEAECKGRHVGGEESALVGARCDGDDAGKRFVVAGGRSLGGAH